jgi:hypothetical protein
MSSPSVRFFEKSSALFSKSDELCDPLLAAVELGGIVEVRHVGQLVGVRERAMILLIWSPMSL